MPWFAFATVYALWPQAAQHTDTTRSPLPAAFHLAFYLIAPKPGGPLGFRRGIFEQTLRRSPRAP